MYLYIVYIIYHPPFSIIIIDLDNQSTNSFKSADEEILVGDESTLMKSLSQELTCAVRAKPDWAKRLNQER